MAALDKEDAGSASDPSSDGESSSSSESSSFGKGIKQEKAAAKKRPKSKAKAASVPAAKKAKTEDSKKSQKAAEKEEAKFESAMAGYQKVLELLNEIGPDMIWRSLVRTVEVERRLSKATSTLDEVQKLEGGYNITDDQLQRVTSLREKLSEQVEWITAMKDLSKLIRGSEPDHLAKAVYETSLLEQFSGCAGHLFKHLDTLADMMHVMAKKICEALVPRHFQLLVQSCSLKSG